MAAAIHRANGGNQQATEAIEEAFQKEALQKTVQPSAAASSPLVRRIAYSGDVESVKTALKGEGSQIQVTPLAEAVQGSGCDVVVIDHSSAAANTATMLADVRSRNLDAPIVLLFNPPDENSVLRTFASDVDDFIVRTPGWATRLPLRLGLPLSRHQQLRELATLRVKEARLRTLVDSLPAAIIRLSPEGTVLAVNTVATTLLGGTETRQLLRKPFYSLVNADDRDACGEFVTAVCGGEQRSLEVSITTLTGERRVLEIKAIPMAATEAGGSASLLAILRDIANRNGLEAPLEARRTPPVEASLANVAEEFSPEAPQATRTDPQVLRELEADLHRLSGRARAAFEELEASLRDAEARHEAAAARRLEEAARQLEEQARLEAVQREHWQSYDSFVQSATHGIFYTPLTGDLQDVNTAFSTLLGYPSPDDLLAEGASIDRFTPVDEWRRAIEVWRQGTTTEPVEARWRKRDGTILTLRLHGRMIGTPHGDERLEVIAENVTAQRVLETELRRARRWEDIARVTSGIAADLKHVIESLNQSTDRFLADVPQDASDETVAAIQQLTSKALSLSRQLVAFGRKGARAPEAIDLNSVVRALEAMMRRIADEHIELTFDLASTLRPIQAEQPTLEEALVNLTLAASDALPAGGRIDIVTTSVEIERNSAEHPPGLEPGSYGLLSLTATGWGIEDSQERESRNPLVSLSRAIAQIGGSLKVETVAGESLTLWVYLPHARVEDTMEN